MKKSAGMESGWIGTNTRKVNMAAKDGIAVVAMVGAFSHYSSVDKFWESQLDKLTQNYFNPPIISSSKKSPFLQAFKGGLAVKEISQNAVNDIQFLYEVFVKAGLFTVSQKQNLAVFGELSAVAPNLLTHLNIPNSTIQLVITNAQTPHLQKFLNHIPAPEKTLLMAMWYLQNRFCDVAIVGSKPSIVLKRAADAIDWGNPIVAMITSAVISDGKSGIDLLADKIDQFDYYSQLFSLAKNTSGQVLPFIEKGQSASFGAVVPKLIKQQESGEAMSTINFPEEEYSFMGNFIKLAMAVDRKIIPKNVWIKESFGFNPDGVEKIKFNHAHQAWMSLAADRKAGLVCCFGEVGMSVVISEPELPKKGFPRNWQLLCFSGDDARSMRESILDFASYIETTNETLPIADVAYTLQTANPQFAHRSVLIATDLDESAAELRRKNTRLITGIAKPDLKLAFLYPGYGSGYIAMAQELYESEPLFAERMDEYASHLLEISGVDICKILYPAPAEFNEAVKLMQNFAVAQPILLAVELALTELLRSWGVAAALVAGHDIGELAAIVASGVLQPNEALTIAYLRGRIFDLQPPGKIITAKISREAALELINADVQLAAIHSHQLVSLLVETGKVHDLSKKLYQQNCWYKILPGTYPVIGKKPELFDELFSYIRKLTMASPKTPIFSGYLGKLLQLDHLFNPDYWLEQFIQPVNFQEVVQYLAQLEIDIAVEIGPGNSLGAYVRRQTEIMTLASLESPLERCGDSYCMLRTLAKLWVNGAKIDWQSFYEGENRRCINLPVTLPSWLQILGLPQQNSRAL
jgi:malonyl CoA-acyl carrier protein transacylase